MVGRLLRNVRVGRTRSGYATYIYKGHHGISIDILERKCGLGIDKSKRTLQSKTQGSVRSPLKPLTRRYITDFLSQRLCQIITGSTRTHHLQNTSP